MKYIVALLLVALVAGCKSNGKEETVIDPTPRIEDVQTGVKKNADSLEKTTANIKKEATDGEQKTPGPVKPTLAPTWKNILSETAKQDLIVAELKAKDAELEKIATEATKLNEFAKKETARADKAEASLADALTKKLYILIMFGALGVAAGVFLMFMEKIQLGVAISVTSAALIFTAMIISTTAKVFELAAPYIAAGIGVIVVAAIGYGVWWAIQKKKEAATLQKSVAEVVATTESTKQFMSEESNRRMFGDGAVVGMAHVIQSPETRKVVSEVRKTIKQAPTIQATSMVAAKPFP